MPEKLLLVAWDAADWHLILRLIDEGKLPHFQSLTEQGTIGRLLNIQSEDAAPEWTSVITGKRPDQHQILADYEVQPQAKAFQAASSLGRANKALWNIFNQNDKHCRVVAWPATYPAEPLAGVVVTTAFTTPPAPTAKTWPVFQGSIHPEDLGSALGKYRLHPRQVLLDELRAFLPDLDALIEAKDPRVLQLRAILAEANNVQAAATAVMESPEWDFAAVHFNSLKAISQLFMNYHPPKLDFVSEADFKHFHQVVETGYILHDMMLGQLMASAGDEATVVVLSTQGYHAGEQRTDKQRGSVAMRKELGLLALKGAGIEKDKLLFQASVLDIVPTLLHHCGLAVGRDMPGKVLSDAFTEDKPIQWVDSWDSVAGDSGEHALEKRYRPLDRAVLKQLSEDQHNSATEEHLLQDHIAHLHFCLVQAFMSSGQQQKAIPILKEIWQKHPADPQCGNKLMNCYSAIKNYDLARETFEKMVAYRKRYALKAQKAWKTLDAKDKSTLTVFEKRQKALLWKQSRLNLAGIGYLHAWLLRGEGKIKEALKVAEATDAGKVFNTLALYQLRGECALILGDLPKAYAHYKKVLDVEPDNTQAHLGLARVSFKSENLQQAIMHASTCIGLRYASPRAHFIYGYSMFKLNQPQKAADALKIAAKQSAGYALASFHRLKLLYEGPLKDPEQAAYYAEKHKQAIQLRQERQALFKTEQELEMDTDLSMGTTEF